MRRSSLTALTLTAAASLICGSAAAAIITGQQVAGTVGGVAGSAVAGPTGGFLGNVAGRLVVGLIHKKGDEAQITPPPPGETSAAQPPPAEPIAAPRIHQRVVDTEATRTFEISRAEP